MRSLMVAVAMSALSQTGCLLGRGLEFVDGGGFPATPPRVDDFSAVDLATMEAAPPGSVIRRVADAVTTTATAGLRFTVYEPNPAEAIVVRVYKNQPTVCARGAVCQGPVVAPADPATPSRPRMGNAYTVRTGAIQFELGRRAGAVCTRIDVYISSRFDDSEGISNRPVDPNDLAHVYWYVIVEDPTVSTDHGTIENCGVPM